MEFKALVSAHIWIEGNGEKDIEILTQIDNDEKATDIFCDIDHALLSDIEIGDSSDYYFIAIVESEFSRHDYSEGIEYEVEHYVKEIKSINDFVE